MIDTAIGQIASQLNLALRRSLSAAEDLVVVSNILEQDGTMAAQAANKLLVFLVNIERETVPFQPARGAGVASHASLAAPPVHLNLMLMFAANFDGAHYDEALKFIGHTVGFFQGRPVLDHQNTPDLDTRIDRLVLEIENLSIADLSNLWGVLSGRYLPSILYRVRLVSIDAHQTTGQVPLVTRPQGRVVG